MAIEVSSSQIKTQPYSNIAYLQVTYPDGVQFSGTASLVGRNDILTATHMVYSPDHGGWANAMDFYFGADYNSITGKFDSYGYHYTPSQWKITGWIDQTFTDSDNETVTEKESQSDIAIIGVNSPIGDDLGWLGLDPGYDGFYLAEAVGYPIGQPGMMHETASIHRSFNYSTYESYYDVMGPGSSGGPLIIDNHVIGVKSTGQWWADLGYDFKALTDFMTEDDSLLNEDAPAPMPLPLDTPKVFFSGKSGGQSFTGGNNVDAISYSIPYDRVSTITQSKDGSWKVTYKTNSESVVSLSTDVLNSVERLNFSDGTHVALDINSPHLVAGAAFALLYAGFNSLPNKITLGHWIAKADQIKDKPTFDDSNVEKLAQAMLTEYAPHGISNADLVNILYTNVVGYAPNISELNKFAHSIDNGTYSQASLFALAAVDDLNVNHYATLVGNGGLAYELEYSKIG